MNTNTGRRFASLDDELLDDEDDDAILDQYLTFRLADEEYGLAISHVIEIIGMQRITEVPDVPPYVMGVVNLRGRVIPVMDVRARFGMPRRPYDDRTCIVVVDRQGAAVGAVVDRVADVVSIPGDSVDPPPTVHKGAGHRYVHGLGKIDGKVTILLDVDRLLGDSIEEAAEVSRG